VDAIKLTTQFVKQQLGNAEGGHDWFHIERVWKNAQLISKSEKGNQLVIELAALLHDIADYKFNGGDEHIGPRMTENFLESIHVERSIIKEVVFIVENISYKGGHNENIEKTIELEIVQDADRLDAIGAIGIARTFNFGGFKGSAMYDPNQKPNINQSKEEYKKSNGTTINHFHEKLLLLKELMNTVTGKMLAKSRHNYMVDFLQQFHNEWDGLK
tara:strand:+ start:84 stop:728 length:645 start_codon:yes stop_codon:yes gene_type:complete